MTSGNEDPYAVTAQEFGSVRVFVMPFDENSTGTPTAEDIAKMLGNAELRADKVEVVKSRIIEGLGLTGYLREGYGVAESDLEGRRGELDTVSGLLVFLPASAFDGIPQTLKPVPSLRLIGLFHEEKAAPPRHMAQPEAAKGALASPETAPLDVGSETRKPTWIFVLGGLVLAAAIILIAVG